MEGCSIHPWWEGSFPPLLCIRQDEKGRQSSLICSCRKVVFVVDGWINKTGHIYATEYYSALERKGIGSVWSQRRPQRLLSFLALFAISPSLLETWSPTRLPVASSQCSATWKCVSRLHQRMWSSTRRRCSSAWVKTRTSCWRRVGVAGGWRPQTMPPHCCHGAAIQGCNATCETRESKKGAWEPWVCTPEEQSSLCQFQGHCWRETDGDQVWLQANCSEEVKDHCTLAEKLGGGVLISLEGKSSWAPTSPLPGASDNPRPAHRVAGCPLPARLGGCGAGIPARGGQSLHSSCQATPRTSRTILLPPSLKVLPASSDCFDLLISSCVEVA